MKLNDMTGRHLPPMNPEPADFVSVLSSRAEHQPHAPAFLELDASLEVCDTITYSQLRERASQLAAGLQSRVTPGARCLLLYPPGIQFAVAFFGCLSAGVLPVPVAPFTSMRHVKRIATLAHDAGALFGMTTQRLSALLADKDEVDFPKAFVWLQLQDVTGSATAEEWKPPAVSGDALAFLQYTSGSTGRPRGVGITHRNLIENANFITRAMQPDADAVVLSWLPAHHDMGLIGCLLQPVFLGCPLYQMSPQHFARKPLDWLKAITRYRVTMSGGADFAYRSCVEAAGEVAPAALDLRCWTTAFSGSEMVRAETLQRFVQTFAPVGFQASALMSCYGMAETTLWVSGTRACASQTVRVSRADLEYGRVASARSNDDAVAFVGCGQAAPGSDLRIVDPDNAVECPQGKIGEIWYAGGNASSGYWNDPDPSRFAAELAGVAGRRYLRTGDLGFIQEGQLYISGRLKDLIIINGRNYFPDDLESIVRESDPRLREGICAAFAVESGGAERLVIVAELQARRLPPAQIDAITRTIRTALSQEANIRVDEVELVTAGQVPRTSSGKVQRSECRRRRLCGELNRVVPATPADLPASAADAVVDMETELLLLRLVEEALKLPGGSVPPEVSLASLGLDSLAAMRISGLAETQLGTGIPLELLFEEGSVRSLARWVNARRSAAVPPAGRAVPPAPASTGLKSASTPFPLRAIQQAYVVGRNADTAYGGVSTYVYMEFEGDLDAARLSAAWNILVARHEMLRAVISPDGTQHVLKEVPYYAVEETDLSALEADECDRKLSELRDMLASRVLPLDQWPLFELRSSRLRGGQRRIHFGLDMLVADLSSVSAILAQLNAQLRDLAFTPTVADFSFRDYVLAERSAAAAAGEAARRYWLERIDSLPPPPQLPLLRPAAAPRFARRRVVLDAARWRSLRARAERFGLTPAAALCAAYAEVLARWSASAHFILSLTLNDRLPVHADVDRVVGDFTRIELLEIDNRRAAGFLERALDQQRRLRADLNHRSFDGVEVLRQMARRRPEGSEPGLVVFTCGLGLPQALHRERRDWRLGEQVYGISQTPQVVLDHHVLEIDGSVALQWDAVEALYPPGVLDDMFASYGRLLDSLALGDESWTCVTPLSLPAVQLNTREVANNTSRPLPGGRLHSRFQHQAGIRPGAPAVIAATGAGEPASVTTYDELQVRAASIAQTIRSVSASDSLVAVVMDKGVAQIVGVLGCLSAGAGYLPIDPRLPATRREQLASRAGARWALTTAAMNTALQWPAALGRICLSEDGAVAQVITAPESPAQIASQAGDWAYVIFTSGSTGVPKGVALDHTGPVNTIMDLADRFELTAQDRVLGLSSLGFDLSVFDIFGPLSLGGALILPPASAVPDPGEWVRLMRSHQVTVWNSVPALMEILVDHIERTREPLAGLPLRLILLSGDWIAPALPPRIAKLWPAASIVSLGGATEASIWSIFHRIEAPLPGWSSVPYGKPLANQRFAVLNERLEPCPDWVQGELFIGGVGLAQCYVGDQQATANSFFRHPESGERLYRTGDLGRYRTNADIEFLGRRDTQVKVNGYRIELGDIEAALSRHGRVRKAVVQRLGDRYAGRLAAYVVLDGSEPLASDELKDHLRALLPTYMIPEACVTLDEFPLNANGKVDRSRLPPPQSGPGGSDGLVGATGASLRLLPVVSGTVAEVMGLESVASDVNFFDLGATSMHLIRIRRRLEDKLGCAIGLPELFRHPTALQLAGALEDSARPEAGARSDARSDMSASGRVDIAIIGMSGRFPGSTTVEQFWQNLLRPTDCLVELEDAELDEAGVPREWRTRSAFVRRIARLAGVAQFDAAFFGISPREAQWMDPQHRMFLECAWEALEDAGHPPGRAQGRVGVFAGTSLSTYLLLTADQLSPEHPARFLETLIANDKDYLASRVSYKLDLDGPSVVVQTACSTSLVAITLGARSLQQGECDIALAGGATVRLPQSTGYMWEDGGVTSPDGHCRPFDAAAQGTVFGSGVGVVVLKRLDDALRDGDCIDAVIKGWGVNNDGARKVGFTAPSVEGQVRVLTDAYQHAGVAPGTVTYVEAHGTGTPLGDPVEVAALREIFRDPPDQQPWCGLGSVKGHVGHLDAAAGVAAVMKTVLSLRHRRIPPTANATGPNAELALSGGPFYLLNEPRVWARKDAATPRRAGISSFGVGGTNCHLVLEEGPEREPSLPSRRSQQLLCVSAMTPEALRDQGRRLADSMAQPGNLADVAATLAQGRRHLPERAAFVAKDWNHACALLQALGGGQVASELICGRADPAVPPKVAFVFSGWSARLATAAFDFAADQPDGGAALARCDDWVRRLMSRSMRDILAACHAGDAETPALELVGSALQIALVDIWRAWGIRPAAAVGYGCGKYAAAYAAGALKAEDVLVLAGGTVAAGKSRIATPAIPALPLVAGETGELLRSVSFEKPPRESDNSGVGAAMATLKDLGCNSFLQFGSKPGIAPVAGQIPGAVPGAILLDGGQGGQSTLETLGRLWVRGAAVEWRALVSDERRHKVRLSTYPWQHRSHWRPQAAHSLIRLGTRSVDDPSALYPLPWRPVRAATLSRNQQLFESHLGREQCPLLADHRIFGEIMVPGAMFVELALFAGSRVLATESLELTDVLFHAPLVLQDTSSTPVQILLEGSAPGAFQFRILSAASRGAWTVHATGCLAAWTAVQSTVSVDSEPPPWSAGETVRAADFYAALRARDVELGPQFRTVCDVLAAKGEAYGKVQATQTAPFFFDPRVLDGCFQVVAAATQADMPAGTFLPAAITRLRIRRLTGSPTLTSHAVLQKSPPLRVDAVVNADVTVYSPDGGAPPVCAEGLRFVRAQRGPKSVRLEGALQAYRQVWENQSFEDAAVPRGTCPVWMVIHDRQGVGVMLSHELELRGHRTVAVQPDSQVATICSALDAALGAAHGHGERVGVLLLGCLDSSGDGLTGYRDALTVAKALALYPRRVVPDIVVLTRGAVAIDERECPNPYQAMLAGFMRSLSAERADWRCLILDLESAAAIGDIAAALLRESAGSRESEVVLRQSGRFVARYRPQPLPTDTLTDAPASPDGCYVITGATGALGLEVSRWLAGRGARTLAWLTRSPGRSASVAVRTELESRGIRIVEIACDVARSDEVRAALISVREVCQSIAGVYHLAGLVEDGLVEGLEWTAVERALAPKVLGALNLDRWVSEEVQEFVCFSSFTTVVGSPGQSAYSASNAFLEALAEARRFRGAAAMTVAWGPWSNAGMAARAGDSLRRRLDRHGIEMQPAQTYLQWLPRLLGTPVANAAVVAVKWGDFSASVQVVPARLSTLAKLPLDERKVEQGPGEAFQARSPAGAFARQLRALPANRCRGALEEYLLDKLVQHLRLTSADDIEPRSRLFDLGLDSLLAIELRESMEHELGMKLPVSLLFDHPTVEALSDYLHAALEGGSAGAAVAAGPRMQLPAVSVAELVVRAGALTDAEILQELRASGTPTAESTYG